MLPQFCFALNRFSLRQSVERLIPRILAASAYRPFVSARALLISVASSGRRLLVTGTSS